MAGFPELAACRAVWDIGDWLGAADRTADAWVTEAVIAKLLADVRKAESDPSPPAARRGDIGAISPTRRLQPT
ncbi:hypothetical protein H4W31_003961 [Plantactinospora soyae]|uniref:Uncharacterized protein n=1 Tax=Plantactinospora soyae TaxID=1544732 RepID=A0A927R065_9ACTN|nr:hypothetical protein [Plantactinospora soyae]